MLERLKSLPLTIVLTILIWMYAESQVRLESDEFENVPVTVAYRPSPYGERLISISTTKVNVSLTVQEIARLGGANNINVVAIPTKDITTLPPDSDQNVDVTFSLAKTPGTAPISPTFNPLYGTVYIHTPPRQPPVKRSGSLAQTLIPLALTPHSHDNICLIQHGGSL